MTTRTPSFLPAAFRPAFLLAAALLPASLAVAAGSPALVLPDSEQETAPVVLHDSSGHGGTGFAGPLVAPPWGGAPKALRGWAMTSRRTS